MSSSMEGKILKVAEYLNLCFPISAKSRVVITVDNLADPVAVSWFCEAIKGPLSVEVVEVLTCGSCSQPYQSIPIELYPKLLGSSFSHWIDFTDQMAVHSDVCRRFVSSGGNFLLLSGLSAEDITLGIFNQDLRATFKASRALSALFRKGGGQLRICSLLGTDITVSLNPEKLSFSRVGELMRQKGIEAMFYGYTLIPICFHDMSGQLIVSDYVWPPNEIRHVHEAIKIEIQEGKIIHIGSSPQTGFLKKWFDQFQNPNVFKITHLTLGLLDGYGLRDSLIMNERIKGAITFGFGNVWSGESPTHTDMVVLNHDIYLDDKKVLLNECNND